MNNEGDKANAPRKPRRKRMTREQLRQELQRAQERVREAEERFREATANLEQESSQ